MDKEFKYDLITEKNQLIDLMDALDLRERVILDTESTSLNWFATLLGITVYQEKSVLPSFVVRRTPFFKNVGIPLDDIVAIMNTYMSNVKAVFHNAKYDMGVFCANNFTVPKIDFDTLLAVHLYDADLKKNLEQRVFEDFGYAKKQFKDIVGLKWDKIPWNKDTHTLFTLNQLGEYAAEDGYWTHKLVEKYEPLIDKMEVRKVLDKIEIPLCEVLMSMKKHGVSVDVPFLKNLRVKCAQGLRDLEEEIYYEAGCHFNINSGKQKAEVLYDKLKLPVYGVTKGGARATDKKALDKLVSNNDSVIAKYLLDYSKLQKLQSGYIEAIPLLVDKDGRLRCEFHSVGARTGRFSCIAGDQFVMTVGGRKRMRNISVGDLVYCYDGDGNVRIRPVLNKWNNGIQKTVRVKWQSTGNMKTGSLICTPDHLIKTKERGWVRADQLKREKVYHLRRDTTHIENGAFRPRLYGTNSFMDKEQSVIRKDYFGVSDPSLHLHHVNGVSDDNRIENLTILKASEHTSKHAKENWKTRTNMKWEHLREVPKESLYGKDNPNFIRVSKFTILRMLVMAGGCPSKVPMDFNTYKNKCLENGVDLAEVCKRFGRVGNFITRSQVRYCDTITTREAYKLLHVGYYRLNELKEYYGVTNHLILSVKEHKEVEVFDIEVEEFNNFIASEICVHNCSDPNLQNQPNNKNLPVRNAFIPRPGYKFIVVDWSQIELRVAAHLSKDPKLQKAFIDGRDIHQEVADRIGCDRDEAKKVNFGILYGLGPDSLAEHMHVRREVAKKYLDSYQDTYTGITAWKRHIEDLAKSRGYVRNMFGRIRPVKGVYSKSSSEFYTALRQAVNTMIQGACADLMKLGMIRVHRHFKDQSIPAAILLTVHDELVIECRNDYCIQVFDEVKHILENIVPMDVPIIAEGKICDNWGQMKDKEFQGLHEISETIRGSEWLSAVALFYN